MNGTHPVALKVMRLSRPTLSSAWQPFFSSSPSFSAHATASASSLQGSTPLDGHPKTLRDLTVALPLLSLPSSFGAVQLGETFSSVVCLHNDCDFDVESVRLKVEMQTVSTKVLLVELGGADFTLERGATLEAVIHHDIKEVGQHVLSCTVDYGQISKPLPTTPHSATSPTNNPYHSFSKYYKFIATNPLSVKTKVHLPKAPSALLSKDQREVIFLEVHIQNLTECDMWFEKILFLPVDGLIAKDVNVMLENSQANLDDLGSSSIPSNFLRPKDIVQYIYILSPQKLSMFPIEHPPGSVIPLGRLDISWRTSFGEPGRLLTSILSRRVPLLPPHSTAAPSALPPHMQREQNLLSQSGSRPTSPFSPRLPSSPVASRPQSPALPPIPIEVQGQLPDLEISLLAEPLKRVRINRKFEMEFSLAVRATEKFDSTSVWLVIQRIQPLPPSNALKREMELILDYQSSPSDSVNKPQLTGSPDDSSDQKSSDLASNVWLPTPYEEDLALSTENSKIQMLGASAIFLPSQTLVRTVADDGDVIGLTANWDFKLAFFPTEAGFAEVNGFRLFRITPDSTLNSSNRITLLQRWNVIGEIWVDK